MARNGWLPICGREVNLLDTVVMSQAVRPALRARGRDRVIMVGFLFGTAPAPSLDVYSASKAAQHAFPASLAAETAAQGRLARAAGLPRSEP